MKMQINEFAKLTGVSVRTLHYYDEIGLLKPAEIDKWTGYRFYDEVSLEKMQQIMFYRELDFSLKSIMKVLSSPDYDKGKALDEQKKLLILKKERLEKLISAIDSAKKGENIMNAFDNTEFENYKKEVKEKWGQTEAYNEYSQKTQGYSKEKFDSLTDGMDSLMQEFAGCMNSGFSVDSTDAQNLVKKLQSYITENFYTCTNEILYGLGQMYVADERFKNNIDKHSRGTAEFISKAVEYYCR
ncbi:MAG: MerR family transcriptional regulator [Clostridia bacterium]|nr:MerR family transcriptional regulator [Clostridia bacterium]